MKFGDPFSISSSLFQQTHKLVVPVGPQSQYKGKNTVFKNILSLFQQTTQTSHIGWPTKPIQG